MAGTLTISTLSDGTNSTSSTNCIQGSAKAWVTFNGVSGSTVRASYNVSSVTRNTTADYTLNFTTAMTDSNYSVSGSVSNNGVTGSVIFAPTGATYAPTTTTFRFQTLLSTTGSGQECPYVYAAVFR